MSQYAPDPPTDATPGRTPGKIRHLRDDGTWGLPGGQGTALLDFGVAPGSLLANVIISTEFEVATDSVPQAWLLPVATVDHTVQEHIQTPIQVTASRILPGAGFRIDGFSILSVLLIGKYTVAWRWS